MSMLHYHKNVITPSVRTYWALLHVWLKKTHCSALWDFTIVLLGSKGSSVYLSCGDKCWLGLILPGDMSQFEEMNDIHCEYEASLCSSSVRLLHRAPLHRPVFVRAHLPLDPNPFVLHLSSMLCSQLSRSVVPNAVFHSSHKQTIYHAPSQHFVGLSPNDAAPPNRSPLHPKPVDTPLFLQQCVLETSQFDGAFGERSLVNENFIRLLSTTHLKKKKRKKVNTGSF